MPFRPSFPFSSFERKHFHFSHGCLVLGWGSFIRIIVFIIPCVSILFSSPPCHHHPQHHPPPHHHPQHHDPTPHHPQYHPLPSPQHHHAQPHSLPPLRHPLLHLIFRNIMHLHLILRNDIILFIVLLNISNFNLFNIILLFLLSRKPSSTLLSST